LRITKNSDLEPPHAIEEKTRPTKFTQNCQETPQEQKDFWSFTKTAVVQAETDSTRERRCCGSNEDGTWDGTRDGTRDRTGPSKAEQEGQFGGGGGGGRGEIFLSGTFRSFVTPIKGGLSLVQKLNSSAHWWLNFYFFLIPFFFGAPLPLVRLVGRLFLG
jgi:hypothetical protein